MIDDLDIPPRRRELAEILHHEQGDMVAPRDPAIEIDREQTWGVCDLDIALLAQFARERRTQRLAAFHTAARPS